MNIVARRVAIALVIVAVGCKIDRDKTSAAVDNPRSATPVTRAAPAATRHLPPVFEKAEGLAEDIQDDVAGGKWIDAAARSDSLANMRGALERNFARDGIGAFATMSNTLKIAIAQRNHFAALHAANELSHTITDMMSVFRTRVPIAVAYMDVIARDAEYGAQQSHWGTVDAAASELLRNYAAVQVHVKQKNAALDASITREIVEIASAAHARQQAEVVSIAKRILEDVDRIEATY